tara:strand:- start:573 stop:845 length:273 start_codon:yes stop_codon:yes gene_type:complete
MDKKIIKSNDEIIKESRESFKGQWGEVFLSLLISGLVTGLTTAFIDIIGLNFKSALKSNWLIFIIIPFSICYILHDFVNSKQNRTSNHTP